MKRFLRWNLIVFLLFMNASLITEAFFAPYPPKVLPYVVTIPQSYWWYDYRVRRGDEALPPPLQPIVDDLHGKGHTTAVMLQVQRRVQWLITYGHDIDTYGAYEYFASPAEALEKGVGDCDEYASLAYEVLRALGFKAAVGFGYVDKPLGGGHAVALVALDDVLYVVDPQVGMFYVYTEWKTTNRGLMMTYGNEDGVHILRGDTLR